MSQLGQPPSVLDRLRRDYTALAALSVVAAYFLIALGTWLGWWGNDWSTISNELRGGMSAAHWFGTNAIGQDIFQRAIYGTRTAFEIGLVVAVLSTLVGALLGGLAGYISGFVDHLIQWLMGVLEAIPFYLFVAAVAFALRGHDWAMHIAMITTFWTSTGRVVRGEVMRLRNFEFVDAARALGYPRHRILLRHILPNTTHILVVQATIAFVAAIKSEVILSFLGLGVNDGVSWGLMIAESTQDNLAGHFNNFIVASSLLFVLVMAFNLFADALQDALDPKQIPVI